MSLEAVQAQAGHRSIESTRVYLHLTNDWLAEQYQRAAALIDANQAAVAEMLAAQELLVVGDERRRCAAACGLDIGHTVGIDRRSGPADG